jgi:hypothetical protein
METAWPLPRWIQPEQYEPPHACLLRLAECNGLPDTNTVRSMTGLAVARIKSGRDLEELALVLHCDVEKLRANATFKRNNTQATVGSQVLRPRDLSSLGSRRACPVCLTEAPYHRVWWDWTFVSSCPFHGCMLAKSCSCGSALTWNDGSPCRCRLCTEGDVRSLTPEPADPKVVAHDRWAVDRFLHPDRAPVHFIDRVPLGHAAETMMRVGALSLGGYQPKRPGMSELGGSDLVRAHGFHIIMTSTVDTALERSYEEYISVMQVSTPSLGRMYGWFYPWFLYTGGPRLCPDLGEIILKNASKKLQVTRRAFLPLLRGGMGSLTLGEAASMAKVRFGTMRAMLVAEGYIRKEQRRGVPALVERATAERIAADLRQLLALAILPSVLGLSFTALTKLVRSGLTPIWVRGGIPGQHRYYFRAEDLSRWMATIIGGAPTVRKHPHGAVSLADAPGRCSIAITVLVRAIVAEDLKVVAVLGERRNFERRNFKSALVDIETVFAYKKKIGAEAAKDPLPNYVRSK